MSPNPKAFVIRILKRFSINHNFLDYVSVSRMLIISELSLVLSPTILNLLIDLAFEVSNARLNCFFESIECSYEFFLINEVLSHHLGVVSTLIISDIVEELLCFRDFVFIISAHLRVHFSSDFQEFLVFDDGLFFEFFHHLLNFVKNVDVVFTVDSAHFFNNSLDLAEKEFTGAT